MRRRKEEFTLGGKELSELKGADRDFPQTKRQNGTKIKSKYSEKNKGQGKFQSKSRSFKKRGVENKVINVQEKSLNVSRIKI